MKIPIIIETKNNTKATTLLILEENKFTKMIGLFKKDLERSRQIAECLLKNAECTEAQLKADGLQNKWCFIETCSTKSGEISMRWVFSNEINKFTLKNPKDKELLEQFLKNTQGV